MTAISENEFSGLMAALGPFEAAPCVGVAVSGGGDSLALTVLADRWARRLGGRAIGLTVDHRLREESTAEAVRVGVWLADRNIEHHILTWTGERPRTRLQETARDARYRLMRAWCRDAGVLHLATAHNQEDQAETFLMRLTRGSGAAGLSGIGAVVEADGVRLVRPLLTVSRSRLRETLRAWGQEWIEDPSNGDQRFRRVLVRSWLPALAGVGYPAARIAEMAAVFGERRAARERVVAGRLAAACHIDPAGFAVMDLPSWRAGDGDIAAAALARILLVVGGGRYAPSPAAVAERVHDLREPSGKTAFTLARCRVIRRNATATVVRESRNLPVPTPVAPGLRLHWDGRYDIAFAGPRSQDRNSDDLWLAPLGRDGWAEAVAMAPDLRDTRIPYTARLTLPAVRDAKGILEIPYLGFRREDGTGAASVVKSCDFAPRNSLSGIGFCLARPVSSTISSSMVEPV